MPLLSLFLIVIILLPLSLRNMEIREIASQQTHALRSQVLRPGKPLSECVFEGDDAVTTRHFAAVDQTENIVGIVSVYLNDNPLLKQSNSYQIRAMATAPDYRGRGVGSALLTAAERYAKSQGATLIWANARSTAIGFYRRSAYTLASEEFMISGIGPHYLVSKPLR